MPGKKYTADEVIHLALMYGICDRRAYAEAVRPPADYLPPEYHEEWEKLSKDFYEEAMEEIEAMQKYHKKRFGWRID